MLVATAMLFFAVHMFLMCAVLQNQTESDIYEVCTTENFLRMLAGDGVATNFHMHLDRSPIDAKVCSYFLQSILVLLCTPL
jgi:hypothetical protein